jgi:hypothetical protein
MDGGQEAVRIDTPVVKRNARGSPDRHQFQRRPLGVIGSFKISGWWLQTYPVFFCRKVGFAVSFAPASLPFPFQYARGATDLSPRVN